MFLDSQPIMGKYILISVLSVLALVGPSVAFLRKIYNPSTELANSNLHKFVAGQDDEPLFLTPYIEQGKLDEARNLSLVRNLPGLSSSESVKSYSGYLTVNKKYNSNIFFWLFPPMVNNCLSLTMLISCLNVPSTFNRMARLRKKLPFCCGFKVVQVHRQCMHCSSRMAHWWYQRI